jgi:hypothetical protein
VLIYHTWPLGQNKLLLRVENIADKFDPHTHPVKYIDVNQLASNLYVSANHLNITKPVGVKIEEVSLSDSMTISQLNDQKSKFRWRGDDDDKVL